MWKRISPFILPALALGMLTFAVIHVVKAQQPLPKPAPPVEPARSPFSNTVAGAGIVEARTKNISIGSAMQGIFSSRTPRVRSAAARCSPIPSRTT